MCYRKSSAAYSNKVWGTAPLAVGQSSTLVWDNTPID